MNMKRICIMIATAAIAATSMARPGYRAGNVWRTTVNGRDSICISLDAPTTGERKAKVKAYCNWLTFTEWSYWQDEYLVLPYSDFCKQTNKVTIIGWGISSDETYAVESKRTSLDVARIGGVLSWRMWNDENWNTVEELPNGAAARGIRTDEAKVTVEVSVVADGGVHRLETSDDLITWTVCDGSVFTGAGHRFFRVVAVKEDE